MESGVCEGAVKPCRARLCLMDCTTGARAAAAAAAATAATVVWCSYASSVARWGALMECSQEVWQRTWLMASQQIPPCRSIFSTSRDRCRSSINPSSLQQPRHLKSASNSASLYLPPLIFFGSISNNNNSNLCWISIETRQASPPWKYTHLRSPSLPRQLPRFYPPKHQNTGS